MRIYHDGTFSVYLHPISESTSRRAAEQEAVGRLLREAFPDLPGIAITHRPDGAPILVREDGSDAPSTSSAETAKLPFISISHCRQAAVILIAPAGVRAGIDIEGLDRAGQLRRVARRFLLDGTQLTDLELVRVWTIKEALYKAALTPGLPLTEIPAATSLPATIDLLGSHYRLTDIPAPAHLPALISIATLLPSPSVPVGDPPVRL